MFRLVGSLFKAIFLIKLLTLAFGLGMGAAFLLQLRQQYLSWGLVEGSGERAIRGDDLVAEPELVETRAIDIDAPPERIWPWLAQLGYGRGGWYSYPVLDRPWNPAGGPPFKSAGGILSEYQDLAEGDLVPTHPQGGFEARIVEPGEALVLYLDDAMFREQMGELAEEMADAVEGQGGGPDLDIELDMPPYQVSWAFELQALAGDRTRLIERLRVHIEANEKQWRARPALATALFVLLRSQLLGIKRRVEDAEAS